MASSGASAKRLQPRAPDELVHLLIHLMPPTDNIALIGYRGVGKTAVAQRLALALGWQWVDADVEVELQAGKSIAALFAEDGESEFRDLESRVLAQLASREKTVLALGGGVVLRPENRRVLGTVGKTIWLTARPETLADRLAGCETTAGRRPNLTSVGGLAEVRQLLAERTPLYEECADLTVDTEGRSPAKVADKILEDANFWLPSPRSSEERGRG